MLPISIYSAALACLAKEQEKPPPTWPGFGQADFERLKLSKSYRCSSTFLPWATPLVSKYTRSTSRNTPDLDNYKIGWEMMCMINLLPLVALK